MHRSLHMYLSASIIALGTTSALAQEAPAPVEQRAAEPAAAAAAEDTKSESDQEIVVTARKREETLKDVPIAATAISGDLIEKRGLTSVKEVAALTPSLNINSDGAGRAFIAIRGVGTTLI